MFDGLKTMLKLWLVNKGVKRYLIISILYNSNLNLRPVAYAWTMDAQTIRKLSRWVVFLLWRHLLFLRCLPVVIGGREHSTGQL
jgi:hypothetical protein